MVFVLRTEGVFVSAGNHGRGGLRRLATKGRVGEIDQYAGRQRPIGGRTNGGRSW